MIDHKEFNQLTTLAKYGPIPVEVVKNLPGDCIYISITSETYIRASDDLLNYKRDFERLLEVKNDLEQFKDWAQTQLDADRQAFANIQNKSERREVIYDGNKHGWLLGWGGGSGYPVGIVESEYNPVETPSALNIKFVNWTKEEKNEA